MTGLIIMTKIDKDMIIKEGKARCFFDFEGLLAGRAYDYIQYKGEGQQSRFIVSCDNDSYDITVRQFNKHFERMKKPPTGKKYNYTFLELLPALESENLQRQDLINYAFENIEKVTTSWVDKAIYNLKMNRFIEHDIPNRTYAITESGKAQLEQDRINKLSSTF